MFVVYNIKSTNTYKTFDTESAAKRSTTCANRNAGYEAFAYIDQKTYRAKVVFKKEVTNLMTGEKVLIDSNTPHCCDPSTETYWSM